MPKKYDEDSDSNNKKVMQKVMMNPHYKGQGQPTYKDASAESAESLRSYYGGSINNLRAPHYVANRNPRYEEYR